MIYKTKQYIRNLLNLSSINYIQRIIKYLNIEPQIIYQGKKKINVYNDLDIHRIKEFNELHKDDHRALFTKETNLKRYVVENTFNIDWVRKEAIEKSKTTESTEKRKQTCMEKYGVLHVILREDVREKMLKCINTPEAIQKSKDTKLRRYGDVNYNREQCKNTCMQRYGVSSYSKTTEFKTFIHNMFLNEEFTNMFKEKIKRTNQERYGVNWQGERTEIKEKIRCINQEKYGVDWFTQTPEFNNIAHKKYIYNNISFASSWEIALYIYLIDHNISFTYQPSDIKFTYIYNNIQHRYFPDFKINGVYYEIKGDYFFNDENILICPYDNSYNELYKQKYLCMLDNNVKILRYIDMIPYLTYVKNNYGKTYLKQFKNY